VVEEVGRENILPNVEAALKRAREISSSFSGAGMEIAGDMQFVKIRQRLGLPRQRKRRLVYNGGESHRARIARGADCL
jgi:hypothetical protein